MIYNANKNNNNSNIDEKKYLSTVYVDVATSTLYTVYLSNLVKGKLFLQTELGSFLVLHGPLVISNMNPIERPQWYNKD